MRIIELGKRGELGTAHIIQESIAMRERCHTELENAVRQIREQHEQSETAAAEFRQSGLQLREACTVCQRQGKGEQGRDGASGDDAGGELPGTDYEQ